MTHEGAGFPGKVTRFLQWTEKEMMQQKWIFSQTSYSAKDTTCFTPDQLQTVRVLLLRHQAAAGATHTHTHTHTHTQPRVIWYKGSNVWQTALWWLKCSSDGPTGSGSVDTGEFLLHQVITSEQHGHCFSFYHADSCFSRIWVTSKRNGSSKPWNIFHNMHVNINVYFPPPSFSVTWRQLCSSWPNMISDFLSCFSTFLWIFPVGK